MKKTLPAFIGLLLGLAGCASMPQFTHYPAQQIAVGPGPEDMVADTFAGRRRLLVSCDERRDARSPHAEIWSVSLGDGKAEVLSRKNEPAGEFSFHPHGIDLFFENGKTFLVVVNHNVAANRQSLLWYEVVKNELRWLQELYADETQVYRRYRYPFREGTEYSLRVDTCKAAENVFTTANDVCVSPDAALLWTNDLSAYGRMSEAVFGAKSGWVGRYGGCEDYRRTRYKIAYPNGLAWYAGDLFVSTTRQNVLLRYAKGDMSVKPEKITPLYGGDNITVSGNELLVTAHLKPLRFLKHRKDPAVKSPSVVYAVNPASGARRTLFADDGNAISAASTAIRIGNDLYICQVFDAFILKVQLP